MATLNTIDTRLTKQLQQACALRSVAIVGVPGGWSVMVKVGMSEKPLGTQRTGRVRQWRSLDTLVSYLRDELGITKIDGVDASGYSAASVFRARPDVAGRMRQAHARLLDTAVASTRRASAAVDRAMDEIDASNQRIALIDGRMRQAHAGLVHQLNDRIAQANAPEAVWIDAEEVFKDLDTRTKRDETA